jgi:microcystin-dependent protein
MFEIQNLGIAFLAPTAGAPYGSLINSNPLGSGNGSAAIAEWANDALLGMYAALDHFGLVPSDTQEQVGDSDLVRVLQANSPVGSVIQMAIDTDPATLDIRALVCDGSTVSEVTYAALFAIIGTKWNTGGEPGGTFRLPAFRGKFLRCFDDGAGVDPARVFAAPQIDAMQGHIHFTGVAMNNSNQDIYGTDVTDVPGAAIFSGAPPAVAVVSQSIVSIPKTDGVNGTPRTGLQTQPINETVYGLIRY